MAMIFRAALLSTLATGPAFPAARAQRADTLRLGIADAVAYYLRSSDENKLALLAVDAADAAVTTARATGLPQMRLTGSYQQGLKNARAEMVSNVFGQSYTYQSVLNTSQTVFQGFRIFSATRAAGRVSSAVRFDAGETRARLAVDVQRTYLNALYLAKIAELQERNLALSTARLEQVEQLAAAGRASRYDILRARVDRSNIEPLALQARSDREIALYDVKRMLDPGVVGAIVRATASDTAPEAIRGSVRAAELSLLAKRDGIRVARADFFPQLSVSFNQGYLALPTVNGLPNRLGETSLSFCPQPVAAGTRPCHNNGFFPDRGFNVQMSWPLFDGLRAKGNPEAAAAQAKIAEVVLHQQREQAALDLPRARAEFYPGLPALAA